MMERTVRILELKELENEWKRIEEIHSSPYQTYCFLSGVPIATSPKDILATWKEINVALWKAERCCMIIPLTIKRSGSTSCEIHLRGYDFGAGVLGVLYSEEIVYDDFEYSMKELIAELKKKYSVCTFKLGRIQDKNLIRWLDRFLIGHDFSKTEQKCVAIDILDCYEMWYESLDRKMRQNVRTMYNRINTDSAAIECEVFIREKIEPQIYDRMQRLYAKRTVEKNMWRKQLESLVYILKKHNGFIRGLNNAFNSFHSQIKINGIVVAFMSGVIDSQNLKVIIPHLAYDSDYKRYSPGILLICETLKYLIRKTNIKTLDLSCGAEDYKYTLGGKEYLVFEYKFIV